MQGEIKRESSFIVRSSPLPKHLPPPPTASTSMHNLWTEHIAIQTAKCFAKYGSWVCFIPSVFSRRLCLETPFLFENLTLQVWDEPSRWKPIFPGYQQWPITWHKTKLTKKRSGIGSEFCRWANCKSNDNSTLRTYQSTAKHCKACEYVSVHIHMSEHITWRVYTSTQQIYELLFAQ
jgi:hypothetical protein